MQEYYLLTFENTHGAMKAESVLKENKIKAVVMPTPTSITKSCGISLKITIEDLEDIKDLIKSERLLVKAIFFKGQTGFANINL